MNAIRLQSRNDYFSFVVTSARAHFWYGLCIWMQCAQMMAYSMSEHGRYPWINRARWIFVFSIPFLSMANCRRKTIWASSKFMCGSEIDEIHRFFFYSSVSSSNPDWVLNWERTNGTREEEKRIESQIARMHRMRRWHFSSINLYFYIG